MKQCPKCGTIYTDDTLRYCLADGSALNIDEQPTVARTVPIAIAEKTVVLPEQRPTSDESASSILKIVIAVIAGFFVLILGLGIAGVVFYYYTGPNSGPGSANPNYPTPSPTEYPQKNNDDELREKIANLEKQLNEQKRKGQNSNISVKLPTASSTVTATVNSPGDGFLALRSLPNSEIGDRILKIPHGARVNIGACGPVVTPVKRSGRWCQASYGGYDGWVFDAYLRYE